MSILIDTLKNKESFIMLKGASKSEIANSEEALGVKFSEDYIEYVTTFGAASYYGHELTGVCSAKSLDVVKITQLEREYCDVPSDWYVIEQAHIDGIVFWQARSGEIYRTSANSLPQKVYPSLLEYIKH